MNPHLPFAGAQNIKLLRKMNMSSQIRKNNLQIDGNTKETWGSKPEEFGILSISTKPTYLGVQYQPISGYITIVL